MSLSYEICHTFFQTALESAKTGKPLMLTLPSEGKAMSYRFQLHKWRSENKDSLDPEFSSLTLRIRPRESGEKNGPYVLTAELDSDEQEFTELLEKALGKSVSGVSAAELFISDGRNFPIPDTKKD